jgi:acetolactate synthase-1/2/3 large subunit
MPSDEVSSYVVELLYRHGIDTYFTVTGGSIVPLLNAVSLHPNARYYCFQHEQAAAMAAEGFYRATGKVAVVCVTSGPGVQNIFNGVCGCWYDSVPAFFICGQVSTTEDLHNFTRNPRQAGFQEMPVPGILGHVSKVCLHLESTQMVTSCMRALLEALYEPRFGPVVLDLPVNLQMDAFRDDRR